MKCGTNTDLTKTNLAAREVQFIWHVYPGAPNNRDPETCEERIIMLTLFNDIAWTKEGHFAGCFSNSEKVNNYARRFQLGHWSFLGPGDEDKSYGTHTY